jgi:hypothetical protein
MAVETSSGSVPGCIGPSTKTRPDFAVATITWCVRIRVPKPLLSGDAEVICPRNFSACYVATRNILRPGRLGTWPLERVNESADVPNVINCQSVLCPREAWATTPWLGWLACGWLPMCGRQVLMRMAAQGFLSHFQTEAVRNRPVFQHPLPSLSLVHHVIMYDVGQSPHW